MSDNEFNYEEEYQSAREFSDSKVRGWVFTINNYDQGDYEGVIHLKFQYLVMGKEVGKQGTPHLQGYIYFKNAKAFSALRKQMPRAWLCPAKANAEMNFRYCSKGGDFIERGTRPMTQKEKGEIGKLTIQARWDLAKAGKFEELPPEQIKTFEYIYSKNLIAVDRDELDNYWIWGDSGCGKSSFIRKEYPVFYTKTMSKWWDNYRGEDVVVLDDYEPSHTQFLSYFLKIWADHYAFNAEVKGGMLKIRPKTIIITSQYEMRDCFHETKTYDAIARRFKAINIINGENSLKTKEKVNHASKKVNTKTPPQEPSHLPLEEAWGVEDGEDLHSEYDSSSD